MKLIYLLLLIIGGVKGLEISSWANIAWGYSDLGIDHLSSTAEAVIIDLDFQTQLIPNLLNNNQTIICYLSGGTYEAFRTSFYGSDLPLWQQLAIAPLEQFSDEAWLDISRLDILKQILLPRFNKANTSGCHAIEVDNVDCFDNTECTNNLNTPANFAQAKALQIAFNTWQTQTAHTLGLQIGLKNALAIIPDLHSLYQFAINEQCLQFEECQEYAPFTQNNKPVLHVEYQVSKKHDICAQAESFHFLTKFCDGSADEGICFDDDEGWSSCFDPQIFANGTFAPGVFKGKASRGSFFFAFYAIFTGLLALRNIDAVNFLRAQ